MLSHMPSLYPNVWSMDLSKFLILVVPATPEFEPQDGSVKLKPVLVTII